MAENIVLIGFMAVGKGKTARELARITGRYTVDTDDLIESMSKSKSRKSSPFTVNHTFDSWNGRQPTGLPPM